MDLKTAITPSFKNGLMITDNPIFAHKSIESGCGNLTVGTSKPHLFESFEDVYAIYKGGKCMHDKILVPSFFCLLDNIDDLSEAVYDRKARLIVKCAYDLEQTGIVEAKYKKSPVMLLHDLGLLSYAKIAGGVYLDKDDLDLINQENSEVIFTFSEDMLSGHGIAPLSTALKRGVNLCLGSGGKANINGNMAFEAALMIAAVNADMHLSKGIDRDLLNGSLFLGNGKLTWLYDTELYRDILFGDAKIINRDNNFN